MTIFKFFKIEYELNENYGKITTLFCCYFLQMMLPLKILFILTQYYYNIIMYFTINKITKSILKY